jgi:hypothetical protein
MRATPPLFFLLCFLTQGHTHQYHTLSPYLFCCFPVAVCPFLTFVRFVALISTYHTILTYTLISKLFYFYFYKAPPKKMQKKEYQNARRA